MRSTLDVEAFRAAPHDCAYVGERFVHFCSARDVFGVVLWGAPGLEDVAKLGASLITELLPHVPRHPSLVDTRALTRADPEAFGALELYVRTNHAALAQKVERLAIVRPAGVVGAVVAGFFQVLDAPYPVTVHEDIHSAVLALGPHAVGLATEIDALGPREEDGLVVRVRAVLEARGFRVDVDGAAKQLALSARTLQRRLADAGTSFAAVTSSARLEAAKRRLTESEDALTAIAFDLGFSSPAHFSAQFKRETGVSPSHWRKRASR